MCDSDGSEWVQLTTTRTAFEFAPRWSPDGRRIAYTSDPEGNRDIYVMSLEERKPRRLTVDPADDDTPAWSGDGNWIYFCSNRNGKCQIWKIPAIGGAAAQVTTQGGARPRLSRDGRFVYFAKVPALPTSVWKVPVDGGSERQVLDESHGVDQFAVAREGIYFTPFRLRTVPGFCFSMTKRPWPRYGLPHWKSQPCNVPSAWAGWKPA